MLLRPEFSTAVHGSALRPVPPRSQLHSSCLEEARSKRQSTRSLARWEEQRKGALLLGSSSGWNHCNLASRHERRESRWPCSNVSVCSKASEMTGEPGGFQSSCDSGSRPPSLLLTTRGVNLCCLRRHGAGDFSSFF